MRGWAPDVLHGHPKECTRQREGWMHRRKHDMHPSVPATSMQNPMVHRATRKGIQQSTQCAQQTTTVAFPQRLHLEFLHDLPRHGRHSGQSLETLGRLSLLQDQATCSRSQRTPEPPSLTVITNQPFVFTHSPSPPFRGQNPSRRCKKPSQCFRPQVRGATFVLAQVVSSAP